MATRTLIRFSLTAVAVLLAADPVGAGSIYARAEGRRPSLYADDTARNFGDVVTIVIEETSKLENDSSRKLEKSSSREASIDGSFQFKDLIPGLNRKTFDFPVLDLSAASDTTHDGSAEYDKSRTMEDKVTVVVEDVLPNGNLVVLGKRRRRVDGDLQTVQISGIIRPSDISFDNEVRSEKIADFHIVYSASGQEKNTVNPGWLTRFLNLIDPF